MSTSIFYNLSNSPLYFVRSGWTNNNAGILRSVGSSGFSWSSMAVVYAITTPATAHYLGFDATVATPSSGPAGRRYAFPLRYLATSVIFFHLLVQ